MMAVSFVKQAGGVQDVNTREFFQNFNS